jgi:hypothetical protein
MSFIIKAVGYGLGALLGVGGIFLISVGTSTGDASATSSGWELVGIAVAMWAVSLLVRESHYF